MKPRSRNRRREYPIAIPLTPDEIREVSKGTPRQVVDRVNAMSTLHCIWCVGVIAFQVLALPALIAGVLVEGFGGTGFILSWFLGGKHKGDDA